MVSTKHMLLFISSAGIHRAVGPSLASAFLTTHAPSAVVPASSAATTAISQTWSRHKQQPMTARFMSTDAEEDEAAAHILTYSVTGTGRGSKAVISNGSGMEMATDVPKRFGGTETAPTPVETLLAALIGCEQATSMYVGRSMNPRLVIDRIEFDLKMDRDARGATELPIESTPSISALPKRCYGTATVYLRGEGKTMTLDQLTLLKGQTEARCPVAIMLKASSCTVDIEWIDGNNVDMKV